MPKHAARRRASREPLIPDKLYFRIGEVAKLCGVETYVLRFWETEFPQMRPNKSGTGQRLYRKRDVELALRVKRLLHDEGYTIAGARQVLTQEAAKARAPQLPLIEGGASPAPVKAKLQRVRAELRDLLSVLSARPAHSAPHRGDPGSKSRATGPNLFE
ncbi:MAG: MerR family transcriptional regulator [Acidobacteriaceae bacterium]